MKILLTSLLGLTSLSAGMAPTIINLNNSNKISVSQQNNEVKPQGFSVIANVGEGAGIITENSQGFSEIRFPKWTYSKKPNKISFMGTGSVYGLQSYVNWGGDIYPEAWNTIDIDYNHGSHDLANHTYHSFLAVLRIHLSYSFISSPTNEYTLLFAYSTDSYASGSTAWGRLSYGPQVQLLCDN